MNEAVTGVPQRKKKQYRYRYDNYPKLTYRRPKPSSSSMCMKRSMEVEIDGILERQQAKRKKNGGKLLKDDIPTLRAIGNAYFRNGYFMESIIAYQDAYNLVVAEDDETMNVSLYSSIVNDIACSHYYLGNAEDVDFALNVFEKLVSFNLVNNARGNIVVLKTLRKIHDEHIRKGEIENAMVLHQRVKKMRFKDYYYYKFFMPR